MSLMALFKYFKPEGHVHCKCLPDPRGALNKQGLIEEANKEVDQDSR